MCSATALSPASQISAAARRSLDFFLFSHSCHMLPGQSVTTTYKLCAGIPLCRVPPPPTVSLPDQQRRHNWIKRWDASCVSRPPARFRCARASSHSRPCHPRGSTQGLVTRRSAALSDELGIHAVRSAISHKSERLRNGNYLESVKIQEWNR